MSTSNNVQEDESFILGSNFFPEDGSQKMDLPYGIKIPD
jgi:hypothetical protein